MSITLTNGTLVQINGSTVENDTVGAVVSMSVDYIGQLASFVLRTGVLLNGNLNAGAYGPQITLTVNLVTGAWSTTNGLSGTISGASLTNFNTQVKGDRNLVETFAAGSSGIMPGTQVAWT